MEVSRVIAIDFDGTLCSNNYPDIGEPYWNVINAAKAEQESGSKLILWTCRTGEVLDQAIAACAEWGLNFDAVNRSTDDWIEAFGPTDGKVGATEYWDDRAVRISGDDDLFHPVRTLYEYIKSLAIDEMAGLLCGIAMCATDETIAAMKRTLRRPYTDFVDDNDTDPPEPIDHTGICEFGSREGE